MKSLTRSYMAYGYTYALLRFLFSLGAISEKTQDGALLCFALDIPFSIGDIINELEGEDKRGN
jgi:hypothetical protein